MSAEFNTVMYRDVDSQLSVAHAALKTAAGFFLRLNRAKKLESGSDEKILEIIKEDNTMLWVVSAGMSGIYNVLKEGFGVDPNDEAFKIRSVSFLTLMSTHLREDYEKEAAKKENGNNEKETK